MFVPATCLAVTYLHVYTVCRCMTAQVDYELSNRSGDGKAVYIAAPMQQPLMM